MTGSDPVSPPPLAQIPTGVLPAYVSNGLIGLRVRQLPLRSSVVMVSGFSGTDGETGVESFARAPYPLAADVCVDGISLRDAGAAVRLRGRARAFPLGGG